MLNVLDRNLDEKTKQIRKRGFIPASIHGCKLDKSIPIEVYVTDFKRLVEANMHTDTIKLHLNKDIKDCKISEVQIDSIDGFVHIDFLLV